MKGFIVAIIAKALEIPWSEILEKLDFSRGA